MLSDLVSLMLVRSCVFNVSTSHDLCAHVLIPSLKKRQLMTVGDSSLLKNDCFLWTIETKALPQKCF